MVFKSLWIISMSLLSSYASPNERRLLNDLLSEYNPLARPVVNDSDAVKLNIGISYQAIQELDETNQILESIVWHQLRWNDPSLKWDESEYGNIEDLRLGKYRVYKH